MFAWNKVWYPRVGVTTTIEEMEMEKGFITFESPNAWQTHIRPGKFSRETMLRSAASTSFDVTLSHFMSTLDGISEDEAVARKKLTGPNLLSVKKPQAWWMILLRSIPNPFNILLAALAIISVATPPPAWANFVILMIMVVISSLVRFWQENRSSVATIKLQAGISATTRVRRPFPVVSEKGCTYTEQNANSVDLVPGDIIALNPGDSIPADCVLLESIHLLISQSSLTGESQPLRKSSTATSRDRSAEAVFDLKNIAFMGTSVVSGSGAGLVIATGDQTYIASITEQLAKRPPKTSFERGLLHVTYLMIAFMIIMVSIVLVLSGKLSGNWGSAALFSVSVAVGIVPEMLPAIVNTNLARGAMVLAKDGAIVKSLGAVQNFGSMSILCSDKTGTLTMDQIAVCRAEDAAGEVNASVLRLAYTNAFHQSGKKNEMDAAILRKQEDDLSDKLLMPGELMAHIPFHFEKRRSSAIIREYGGGSGDKKDVDDALLLICKGALEEVLELCTAARISHGQPPVDLDPASRQAIYSRAHTFNDDGYRVLAVATRRLAPHTDLISPDGLERLDSNVDMVLEGLVTFLDPPREDAAASIASLQQLGVEIKILTGDNLRIAIKVCRSLNISGTAAMADQSDLHIPDVETGLRTVTGPELSQLDDEEFHDVVQNATILAKLTPTQKGQVVLSLKRDGRSVGMLGDGINDCIALRFADVGISVDNAVSVAKDSADVILTQKRLDIILSGVRTGRLTHGNTMKYIKMVASGNFGNVFSVLIASAWLPYQPMTSLQILVQNLLYDLSQVALPWDSMDEEYLRAPKNWDIWDLLRFVVILGPTSSTIDMCTFSLNWFYYGIRTANDIGVPLAHTHWFLEGLLTQTTAVFILRTALIPILQSRPATMLAVSSITISAIGIALPYIPRLSSTLSLVTPAPSFLGFLAAELVLYWVEVQTIKYFYKRIFGRWL